MDDSVYVCVSVFLCVMVCAKRSCLNACEREKTTLYV